MKDEVRLLWLDGSSVRVKRIDARSGAARGAALAFDTGTAMDAFVATQARGLSSGRFLLWSDTDVASLSCQIGG